MNLKHIIREMKNSFFMNVLIILQMVVVFMCTIAATSIISYYYNYYYNSRCLYEGEGMIYKVQDAAIGDEYIQTTKDMEENLQGYDVIGMYDTLALYYDKNNIELDIRTISYDKEIIETYKPKLKTGRWINPDRTDGVVEAVVMESNYDISLGDKLNMHDIIGINPELCIEVEVVGIIDDGARILAEKRNISPSDRKGLTDYRDLYVDYYIEDERKPVILTSVDSIHAALNLNQNAELLTILNGLVFVNYAEDVTDEEIKANNDMAESWFLSTSGKISMNEFRQNSTAVIKEKLYGILPVFFSAFILVIISGMCNFAISIKEHMREYTIFAICGMPWKNSMLICFFKALILTIASMILGVAAVFFLLKKEIIRDTTIEIGIIPLLACVGVGLLYILVSTIMPYALVKGTNLSSELRDSM